MKKLIYVLMLFVLVANVYAIGGAEIKASILRYEPTPAEQGNTVDIWIQLSNAGTKANRVAVKFVPEYPFSLPAGQKEEIDVGIVAATEDKVVKFTVFVDQDAPNGDSDIEFWYKYSTIDDWVILETSITLESQDSVLVIDSYKATPSPVAPGQEIDLAFTLRNEGRIAVKNVDVSIDLEDGKFSTIGTGAKQRVKYIPAGETEIVRFDLASDTTTEVKLYAIPVTLEYQDERNKNYDDTAKISLVVNSEPELSLNIDSTDFDRKTNPGTVSLKVVNKGVVDIKYVTVKLENSDEYEILSASREAYVGNLDSDDFETVDFIIKPLVREPILKVSLEFKDPYNTPFKQERHLPLRIITDKDLGKSKTGAWPIILLLLIAAGIWYWHKRRKKK